MITKQDVISVCKTIQDPEIQLDIYTLGLVYDIKISPEQDIYLVMTYTTPTCPFGARMQQELTKTLNTVLKPKSVQIRITFEPAWKPSPELRQALGL